MGRGIVEQWRLMGVRQVGKEGMGGEGRVCGGVVAGGVALGNAAVTHATAVSASKKMAERKHSAVTYLMYRLSVAGCHGELFSGIPRCSQPPIRTWKLSSTQIRAKKY